MPSGAEELEGSSPGHLSVPVLTVVDGLLTDARDRRPNAASDDPFSDTMCLLFSV